MNKMIQNDFIIDVGMHDGSDTAYYLSRGFRVLGIEANPHLCELARQKFQAELATGQLTILNVGIASGSGHMDFWINTRNTELSSFDRSFASRFGGELITSRVETLPFRTILQDYGTPYYLKVDIEGHDDICLRDLDPLHLPQYISAEGHTLSILFLLYEKGYREFKCINQRSHEHPRSGRVDHSRIRRAIGELCHAISSDISSLTNRATLLRRMWRVPKRLWRPFSRKRPLNLTTQSNKNIETPQTSTKTIPPGGSGRFGEDTIGPWSSFEEVAYDWLHIKSGHPHRSTLATPGWYDFHARRSTP